jgi:hypothetical protein
MPIPAPNTEAMHDLNWCENCGSMISRIQLRQPGRDGLTKLVDHLVCNCRGRPKPAASDRPEAHQQS